MNLGRKDLDFCNTTTTLTGETGVIKPAVEDVEEAF